MIKCAGIYTCEVDDFELAVNELNSQINEKINLLDNTVGIVMCHIEFIESGMLEHVCKNLPFDIAGVTTASQAVNEIADDVVLTIFIMTSDDVHFHTGMTGPFVEDLYHPVKTEIDKIGHQEKPQLALIFPPLPDKHAGDTYVDAWERVIPGVPLFGTFSTADTADFTGGKVIFNGETADDRVSYIFCYGNITPRFLIGTFSDLNAMPYHGEITKSNGIYVEEINNIKAYDYFEKLGLAKDGEASNIFNFVPFLIDQKNRGDYDGVPILRELVSLTEDGVAIFRGNIDELSTFKMLQGTFEDVILIAKEKLNEAVQFPDINGILTFSCIARRMMVMQKDTLRELNVSREIVGDIPFMMGYAGGEICPTSVKNGAATNRYHDYSIITMVI